MKTAHCTLHTANYRLHTTHCTLQTAHCKLCTEHCTLNTVHYTIHTANCSLNTAHYTLHTAQCTLQTAHCTLKLWSALYPSPLYLRCRCVHIPDCPLPRHRCPPPISKHFSEIKGSEIKGRAKSQELPMWISYGLKDVERYNKCKILLWCIRDIVCHQPLKVFKVLLFK